MRELTFVEAINEALKEEMARDERVYVIGEDVRFGYGGGTFGASKGLLARFGPDRVIDSPISESAIAGTSVGAALWGMRPVAEIMFADFMALAMDHVANSAAKMRFAYAGEATVPVVFRMAFGAGVGAALARVLVQPAATYEELLDLDGDENHRLQGKTQDHLAGAERLGLEDDACGRQVDGEQLQHDGQQDRAEERPIRPQALPKQRLRFRTDGKDMAHLRQRQHREDHGLPVRHARVVRHACVSSDVPPMSSPTHRMCCHMPCAKRLSAGGRGGRCMMPFSAGSAASATPGRPSVTRLIQRMWMGSSGMGRPRNGARKIVQISPELQVTA